MSGFIISGFTNNVNYNNYNNVVLTSYTYSYSGTSYVIETEQEKAVRIRKEIREMRNKKLDRIYGREPEKSNIPEMETDIG